MGYITNLSSNRTPTVQACNEAYGFDAGSISGGGGITLGPHDSNRFMINVYYNSPVDLRTILKDTDPIDCVYAFIIVAEEVYHTVWLYRGSDGKFKPNGSCYKDDDGYRLHLHIYLHSDGTASYEHIYLQPDGYTIEANWVE